MLGIALKKLYRITLNWSNKPPKLERSSNFKSPVWIGSLSSAEAPTGIPKENEKTKTKHQKKKERKRARGGDDEKKEDTFPSSPRAFFFPLPSLLGAQRGLCGGERDMSKSLCCTLGWAVLCACACVRVCTREYGPCFRIKSVVSFMKKSIRETSGFWLITFLY